MDRINHLPIFSYTERTDCPFAGVIIHWHITICQKYFQVAFLIQRVMDCFAKLIFFRYIQLFYVRKKRIHKRSDYYLPLLQPFIRRQLTQFSFLAVDGLDLFHDQECFGIFLESFIDQFQRLVKSAPAVDPASCNRQLFQFLFEGMINLISICDADPLISF